MYLAGSKSDLGFLSTLAKIGSSASKVSSAAKAASSVSKLANVAKAASSAAKLANVAKVASSAAKIGSLAKVAGSASKITALTSGARTFGVLSQTAAAGSKVAQSSGLLSKLVDAAVTLAPDALQLIGQQSQAKTELEAARIMAEAPLASAVSEELPAPVLSTPSLVSASPVSPAPLIPRALTEPVDIGLGDTKISPLMLIAGGAALLLLMRRKR